MSNIPELLKSTHTIAVVGLSSNPMRPSNGVAEYLKRAGYHIIPVNPNEGEVLGEKSYARLEDIPEKIDMVDIFRRSECVPEIVESAIRVAAKRARRAGLEVVMDRCTLKEHRKMLR